MTPGRRLNNLQPGSIAGAFPPMKKSNGGVDVDVVLDSMLTGILRPLNTCSTPRCLHDEGCVTYHDGWKLGMACIFTREEI